MSLFWFVTFLGLMKAFMPALVNAIMGTIKESTDSGQLREEIAALKREQSGISMMDQFAKHAKVQRKINALTEQLKQSTDSTNLLKIKLKYGTLLISYITTSLTTGYLIYMYGQLPLLVTSPDLFYPLSFLLNFPTGVPGGVSITSWMAITFFVGKRMSKSIVPS